MFSADGESMAKVSPQVYEHEVDDRETKTLRRPVGCGVFMDAAEPGASGDLVQADVAREAVDGLLCRLQDLGVQP